MRTSNLIFVLWACLATAISAGQSFGQARLVAIKDIEGEPVIVSADPVLGHMDRVLLPQADQKTVSAVNALFRGAGVTVGIYDQIIPNSLQKDLGRPKTGIVVPASVKMVEMLEFLFVKDVQPNIYRFNTTVALTEVSLIRDGKALNSGNRTLAVDTQDQVILLVNGAAAKGISVLFYPRETGKSVAEKIIGETGIKPERLTAFKPNDAAALTQPQQAFLTGIATFRQPQFDVLLARAPGLKVYMIEKAVELEHVLIGGIDAQKERPQPEDASGRSEPIASAPEPQPVRPPEPPAIVKETVSEAPETTPAPTPAENVPQPDLAKTIANLRERAHQTSQGCGRFFGWLSKYHLEYGVNPAAVQDFKSQIDLLKDSKIPEFIKLFLPQESTGYFGKPYDQVTSKAIGSRMTEARICVNTLFSSDNKVLESYADLISYIGTRSKRVPWSKVHERAISSIQHAYDQRSNLLSEVRNPPETTDGTTLTKNAFEKGASLG